MEMDVGQAARSRQAISPDGISDAEIMEQLERLLGSAEFKLPERGRRFLTYVVGESLKGRGDRIKAHSIAVEVFGRGESFDAQHDPAVRIEASRLRLALERYYLVAGQADPILISIPKGGYSPVFVRRQAIAPPMEEADAIHRKAGKSRFLTWTAVFVVAAAIVAAIVATEFNRSRTAEKTGARPGEAAPIARVASPTIRIEPFLYQDDEEKSKDLALGTTAEIVNQFVRFKNITVIAGGRPFASPGADGIPTPPPTSS